MTQNIDIFKTRQLSILPKSCIYLAQLAKRLRTSRAEKESYHSNRFAESLGKDLLRRSRRSPVYNGSLSK